MIKHQNQNGFLLISLLLAVAIIAILVAVYYGGGKNSQQSQLQTGQKAIEQTKQNNTLLENQHLEIQNQLNSINQ